MVHTIIVDYGYMNSGGIREIVEGTVRRCFCRAPRHPCYEQMDSLLLASYKTFQDLLLQITTEEPAVHCPYLCSVVPVSSSRLSGASCTDWLPAWLFAVYELHEAREHLEVWPRLGLGNWGPRVGLRLLFLHFLGVLLVRAPNTTFNIIS